MALRQIAAHAQMNVAYPPYCEECIAFRGSPFTRDASGESLSPEEPAQTTDMVPGWRRERLRNWILDEPQQQSSEEMR